MPPVASRETPQKLFIGRDVTRMLFCEEPLCAVRSQVATVCDTLQNLFSGIVTCLAAVLQEVVLEKPFCPGEVVFSEPTP